METKEREVPRGRDQIGMRLKYYLEEPWIRVKHLHKDLMNPKKCHIINKSQALESPKMFMTYRNGKQSKTRCLQKLFNLCILQSIGTEDTLRENNISHPFPSSIKK